LGLALSRSRPEKQNGYSKEDGGFLQIDDRSGWAQTILADPKTPRSRLEVELAVVIAKKATTFPLPDALGR